jgi:hypothetical protein
MNTQNDFKITLTNEKAEEIFFNALCNGQHYLGDYGFELFYSRKEYIKAKKELDEKEASNCWEDILMQILRNGQELKLVNNLEEEDVNEREIYPITLQDVYKNMALVPTFHLMDMLNEKDDAITADAILQTIFFKEIVYC